MPNFLGHQNKADLQKLLLTENALALGERVQITRIYLDKQAASLGEQRNIQDKTYPTRSGRFQLETYPLLASSWDSNELGETHAVTIASTV